jgi:hypothetical protein
VTLCWSGSVPVLASVFANTEGGSYMTLAIPLGMFCVIGAVLYWLLFARPHARVPARSGPAVTRAGPGSAAPRPPAVDGEPLPGGDGQPAADGSAGEQQ